MSWVYFQSEPGKSNKRQQPIFGPRDEASWTQVKSEALASDTEARLQIGNAQEPVFWNFKQLSPHSTHAKCKLRGTWPLFENIVQRKRKKKPFLNSNRYSKKVCINRRMPIPFRYLAVDCRNSFFGRNNSYLVFVAIVLLSTISNHDMTHLEFNSVSIEP